MIDTGMCSLLTTGSVHLSTDGVFLGLYLQ